MSAFRVHPVENSLKMHGNNQVRDLKGHIK